MITVADNDGVNSRPLSSKLQQAQSRSRSRRRTVTDVGQTGNRNGTANGDQTLLTLQIDNGSNEFFNNTTTANPNHQALPTTSNASSAEAEPKKDEEASFNVFSPNRPTAGGVAFPFKLYSPLEDNGRNASTVTLESQPGIVLRKGDEVAKQLDKGADNEVKETPISAAKGPGTDDEGKVEYSGNTERRGESEDEKKSPIGGVEENRGGNTKGRRGTVQDAKGLLHHGLVSRNE